jgi:antirestriction protein
MMTTNETPRVYVACLAAYNAGRLHGEWVDADDADTIREGIAHVLKTSPIPGAEEWAFHDFDGFGGLALGEYEDVDKVAELGAAIAEHGAAFAAYAGNVGTEYADVDGFEEAYQGEHDSEEDFAQSLADDLGAVPDDLGWPLSCIDWERAARELFTGDYYSINSGGGVYVFRSL